MTEKQIQAQAAKEYLSRLRGTVEQIQSLEDRIDESERRGGYGTGRRAARNLSGAGMRSKVEDAVCEIDDTEDVLRRTCHILKQIEATILRSINAVTPDAERSVLMLRYLNGYDWDEIARKMDYCRTSVITLHGRALLKVKVEDLPDLP